MKKRILGLLLVMMLGVSVCACGKTEDTNTNSVETGKESTTDDTQENNTEVTTDDTQEDTTQSTTEESTESGSEDVSVQFDMKKMNLSGLYYSAFDSCGVIITDDGKIIAWACYEVPEKQVKSYDVISVELETEWTFHVPDSLCDTTYKIIGKASDGEECFIHTDGRMLRNERYDEENNFYYPKYNAADHVHSYDEYTMSEMPSTFEVPVFDEVVVGAELDANMLSEVCGLYYSPSIESGSDTHECAFVISEDGYLYEWDNLGEISSDGKWQKSAIVRLYVPEEGDPDSIIIDTRYHSYTFDSNGDETNLSLLYNVMQYYTATCEKVDELPSNVPTLK